MSGKVQGQVIVVSAPSGTGKTTLNRRLAREHPEIEMSVSYTTRAPRPTEVAGKHYFFITEDEFKQRVAHGDFLEWAKVHGYYYGTSKSELDRISGLGHISLLEIDPQGWIKAKPLLSNAKSIFIFPPSLKTLWDRLENRGSDPLAVRLVRLQNAYEEIQASVNYDFFIINENLDKAYAELQSIVFDGKAANPKVDVKNICARLKAEFETAEWLKKIRDDLPSRG
jgi:guanylate kinase